MENAQLMNEIEHEGAAEREPHEESASNAEHRGEETPQESSEPVTEEAPQNEVISESVEPDTAAAESSEEADEEPKKKRLSTGLTAAKMSGSGLKAVGVATTRMAVEKASTGTDQIPEGEEFDPAADLPMYRPGMDWFVLRVASNKESSVRETLLRKVQIEAMENLVGRIMVPTEKTKTLKGGKQRVTETKLYPGYVFVEMRLEPDGRIPQDVFFLIKETTGVGDFVGTAGRPTPMGPNEVEKMLFDSRRPEETPQVKMEFEKGDNVTIKEGPFENYEGTVDTIHPEKGIVLVLVTIFGRQAPVELEYWQIVKSEE